MSKRITLVSLVASPFILVAPALAVSTSHWTQTTEADFKEGTLHNVVATNLGDVKLSRAVKTILEQDAKVTSVNALAEAPDGTVYAGTGPSGILLAVKGDKVSTAATLDGAINILSLMIDKDGGLLLGTGGEKGKVYRIDKPGDKPREIFAADGVQYVWALAGTADGTVYAATGPNGQLFAIKPDGSHEELYKSGQNNVTSLLSDGGDLLYLGTDPNGIVVRLNRRTRESFVLYNAGETEITALALDAQGNLYAATGEAGDRTPQQQQADAAAKEKTGRPDNDTGGAPIPSAPPSTPKPPAVPNPNPGEPAPIPKDAPVNKTLWNGGLPPSHSSPSSGTPGEGRGGGSAQSMFFDSRMPAPRTPTLTLPRSTGGGEMGASAFPKFLVTKAADDANGDDSDVTPPTKSKSAQSSDDEPGPGAPPAPGGPEMPGTPAVLGANRPATPLVPNPPANADANKPEGNAIYRIDKDGFVTEIFRQNAVVYAMVEQNGVLLVGTGPDGNIYQVNPAAEETVVLAKVDPKQVMTLLPAKDGRILMGLANTGGIAAMTAGYASDGTLTSPVLDATQVSRFGKIQLHGNLPDGTTLKVATRSGNVKEAEAAGWSKWSDDVPATEFVPVTSPSARFLQYRLTFTSTDGSKTPVVGDVDVAYQIPNLPPVIKSVKIGSGENTGGGAAVAPNAAANAPAKPGANAAEAKPGGTGTQTITWDASDPNNDPLTYSLYFRTGSTGPWILLKDKLKEPTYEWDTKAVADGRYQIKVVASDAAANPPGTGKTTSRVSDPYVVDNTPPTIGDLNWKAEGANVKVDLRIADRTSTVANCEYAVDSNDDWQAVLPSDNIFDDLEETVSFTVPNLSAGTHQITLRATDARGNQAFQALVVKVEGPTAASK